MVAKASHDRTLGSDRTGARAWGSRWRGSGGDFGLESHGWMGMRKSVRGCSKVEAVDQ